MKRELYSQKMAHLYRFLPDTNRLFNYGAENLDTSSYWDEVLSWFMDYLPPKPAILDLGSGLGLAAEMMRYIGPEVTKLDLCLGALQLQRGDRIQANALDLPFAAASFAGVHCKDMISHIPPSLLPQFFAEIQRVLQPHGHLLLVSNPTLMHLLSSQQWITRQTAILEAAALQGLNVQDIRHWTPSAGQDWYGLFKKRDVILLSQAPK